MKKENELDLNLKLRMMRYLWYNGYFTRKDVNLLRYSFGKKTDQQYTDIDVLGLRIDRHFMQRLIICDCKSGARAKTAERIFWLSGVMKYLNADQGFFLRTKVTESRYLDLAERLEIVPLSTNQLLKLEKTYNIESKPYVASFNEDIIGKDEVIFNKIKDEGRLIYDYIAFRYWIDPIQQRITSLVQSEYKIDKLSTVNDKEKTFLQLYVLSLFSISVLKFSESVLIVSNNEKEDFMKENLLGGRMESTERKKLFRAFYDFMKNEIKERYNKRYPIPRIDFMSHFYPKYLKYLLDLIERICLKPTAAIQVPRLLDILAYEIVLNEKGENIISQVFSHDNNFNLIETSKLTRDFFTFGYRSGFISEERFDLLKGLMLKIGP